MIPFIVIGLLVAVPVVLIFILRVNAAIVLLALCAGDVLQRLAGNDGATIFGSLSSKDGLGASQFSHLLLLLVPPLVTLLFLRKSIAGSKSLLNLLPAVATGALTALLAVPLLAGGLQYNIVSTSWWNRVNQFQGTIAGATILIAFFMLWLTYPKHNKDKKHK